MYYVWLRDTGYPGNSWVKVGVVGVVGMPLWFSIARQILSSGPAWSKNLQLKPAAGTHNTNYQLIRTCCKNPQYQLPTQ